jgi:hypothetical protein
MRRTHRLLYVVSAASVAALVVSCASAPKTGPKSFFVTSVSQGDGANPGGLAGADAHCQKPASAAGAGNRKWRAYLSTGFIPPSTAAVHARDRIGNGPWFNQKERRRTPWRQEQRQQRSRAEREGRCGEPTEPLSVSALAIHNSFRPTSAHPLRGAV